MSFEKYCHSIGMEETRIVKGDMVSMCTFKEAWDHQQKKIQTLQEENKLLMEFVRGVIRYAGNSCDDYLMDKAQQTIKKLKENK